MDKGKQAERLMNSSLPAALVPAYSGKEKTATLIKKIKKHLEQEHKAVNCAMLKKCLELLRGRLQRVLPVHCLNIRILLLSLLKMSVCIYNV